jgi:dethiobiotin synthetase
MAKPLIIMVGADKGGVGKTTITRTLLNYFKSKSINYRAYDTEAPNGVLKRFHPDSDIVDLALVADQMMVLDTISTACVTVVDIRAGLLTPTLETFANVGLLDQVRSSDVNLAVLHVLGASVASLNEVALTAGIIKGAKHYLVKNHINDTAFFEWDKATSDTAFNTPNDGVIEIPRLAELACEHVESKGSAYDSFAGDSANSFVLRGYVRTWLRSAYAAYDAVGLDTLASGSVALGHAA